MNISAKNDLMPLIKNEPALVTSSHSSILSLMHWHNYHVYWEIFTQHIAILLCWSHGSFCSLVNRLDLLKSEWLKLYRHYSSSSTNNACFVCYWVCVVEKMKQYYGICVSPADWFLRKIICKLRVISVWEKILLFFP